MKKSTAAALHSGLVFPGIGQFYLKRYARGALLALGSAVAMYIVIDSALETAMEVARTLEMGDVSLDAGSIESLIAQRSAGAGPMASLAQYLFLALWAVGSVDAYRLGRAQESPQATGDQPGT
jgi:hypothetical protein